MKAEDKNIFDQLSLEAFGEVPVHAAKLPAAGGDRAYWRLNLTGLSVLGVVADNLPEARAYVELTRAFRSSAAGGREEFHVPQVYAHTADFSHYLVQDVGAVSLFDMLGKPEGEMMVERTLRSLVKLQTVAEKEWLDKVAFAPFSRRLVMWDLNYFKYEFLKNTSVVFDEAALEDDFERLAEDLCEVPEPLTGFMYRDCQSRNVMIDTTRENAPFFIDFQGGRKGPVVYDAVSLLWQAKAGFSSSFRRRMLGVYADELSAIRNVDPREVTDCAGKFALFRTLQVLGAYGFRGLVQKRAHFIESIPGALVNLRELITEGKLSPYPELERVAKRLIADHRFNSIGLKGDRLTIKVFSFSYKKGYPEDLSGNGGGFMFDCRGMHNPGRYDEYKPLTGYDEPVIKFLQERGEADKFAAAAVDLVAPTVERYLKRGFTSLQIGFGCTGGRHRSVYCANAAARHLARRYPDAEIELIHREQNIHEALNSEKPAI